MNPPPLARACALLVILALCRGSAYGFTQLALNELSPGTIVFLRFAFGAIAFVVVAAFTLRDFSWLRSDWRGAVFHAFIGNLFPIGLITIGQQTVPSGLAAVAMALTPLLSASLAHFLVANERLTLGSVSGLLIGFGGVLVIVLARNSSNVGSAMLPGICALVAAATCFAIQLIFARRWSPRSAIGTSTLSLTIAATFAAPFISAQGILAADGAQLAAAGAGLGVIGTALAMLILIVLATRSSAAFASIVNYLIPAVGLGIGAVFFGEDVYWRDLAGLGLIVAGTAFVQSSKSRSSMLSSTQSA